MATIGKAVMMNKIIYVFSESDKQKLNDEGLIMLKEDKDNSIFAFAMTDTLKFDMNDLTEYVLSDTLTF